MCGQIDGVCCTEYLSERKEKKGAVIQEGHLLSGGREFKYVWQHNKPFYLFTCVFLKRKGGARSASLCRESLTMHYTSHWYLMLGIFYFVFRIQILFE
jgi:hypothetical protein